MVGTSRVFMPRYCQKSLPYCNLHTVSVFSLLNVAFVPNSNGLRKHGRTSERSPGPGQRY